MQTLTGRYRQANKEAMWAFMLALAFFAWWYGFAYGLSPEFNATELPTLYFGLPAWFLLSCVVGPVLFTALCAVMVKFLYKDMPLDVEQERISKD